MSQDPEAKLQHSSTGSLRIVARFRRTASLLEARDAVTGGGVFYLKVDGESPTSVDVEVLFRTAKKGERFHATILAWNHGNVVLRPKLPAEAFTELTGSLLTALSEELGFGPVASDALEESEASFGPTPSSGSLSAPPEDVRIPTPDLGYHRVPISPSSDWPTVDARGTSSESEPSADEDSTTAHATTEDGGVAPDGTVPQEDASTTAGPRATGTDGSSHPALTEHPEDLTDAEDLDESEDDRISLDGVDGFDAADHISVKIEVPEIEVEETDEQDPDTPVDADRAADDEGWQRIRTGQSRVTPGISPQARPGAFSPPQDADSGLHRMVSGFFDPADVEATDETASHPAAQANDEVNFNSELLGAHVFLNHLERDESNVVQGSNATGKEAVSFIKQADTWQPGAILITSHPDSGRLWYLFISGGKIVNAYRLPPSGTVALTPRLLSKGLITLESAKRVLDTARKHGLSEESALARHKLVDQQTLTEAVVQRVRNVTSEMLAVENVRFKLYRLMRFPRQSRLGSTEVDTYRDLMKQLLELSDEDMTARETPHFEHFPMLKVRSDLLSQTLSLSDEHEQFISTYIGGDRQLLSVYSEATLDREESFAVIFALQQMSLVTFNESPHRPAIDPDESSPAQRQQSELNLLVESRVRFGNHMDPFEYLGLSWWATSDEVDKAIARFEQALSPQKLATASPEIEKSALQVLQAARDAYAKVRTPEMRSRHRRSMLDPRELKQSISLLEADYLLASYRGDRERSTRILGRIEELDESTAKTLSRRSSKATIRASK